MKGLVTNMKKYHIDEDQKEIIKERIEDNPSLKELLDCKSSEVDLNKIVNECNDLGIGPEDSDEFYFSYYLYALCMSNGIDILKNISEIPEYCFYGCEDLDEIVIPDNIKRIGKGAFAHCALKKATISSGEIEEMAFADNDLSLFDELHLGKGVSSIGFAAFRQDGATLVKVFYDGIKDSFYSICHDWYGKSGKEKDGRYNDNAIRDVFSDVERIIIKCQDGEIDIKRKDDEGYE